MISIWPFDKTVARGVIKVISIFVRTRDAYRSQFEEKTWCDQQVHGRIDSNYFIITQRGQPILEKSKCWWFFDNRNAFF
jgi:hypothetical protein